MSDIPALVDPRCLFCGNATEYEGHKPNCERLERRRIAESWGVKSAPERFGEHVMDPSNDPERRQKRTVSEALETVAKQELSGFVKDWKVPALTQLAEAIAQREDAAFAGMDAKPTNPKDLIGSDKVPMHLFPGTAITAGSIALLDGMLKYGRTNWREAGVRFSIYFDAAMRHLLKAFEGEDIDPDSGLPHEWHILACMAIIIDARAAGKLVDDRQYPGGFINFLREATEHVTRLKEKYMDHDPKHYTIEDAK